MRFIMCRFFWRWTFWPLTLESCLGWYIPLPSLIWIWLTVPELGRPQFSIDRQLSPNFYVFFWGGWYGESNFKVYNSNPKNALPWSERFIMTYVGVRPKVRPVAVAKWPKDINFHASNWLFAQTTHVDISPWNFACGSYPGSNYTFQVS